MGLVRRFYSEEIYISNKKNNFFTCFNFAIKSSNSFSVLQAKALNKTVYQITQTRIFLLKQAMDPVRKISFDSSDQNDRMNHPKSLWYPYVIV